MDSSSSESILTIQLPAEDLRFAEAYGARHGISLAELFDRYLRILKELEHYQPSISVQEITGLVPSDIDVKEVYQDHLKEKHDR